MSHQGNGTVLLRRILKKYTKCGILYWCPWIPAFHGHATEFLSWKVSSLRLLLQSLHLNQAAIFKKDREGCSIDKKETNLYWIMGEFSNLADFLIKALLLHIRKLKFWKGEWKNYLKTWFIVFLWPNFFECVLGHRRQNMYLVTSGSSNYHFLGRVLGFQHSEVTPLYPWAHGCHSSIL